MSHRPVLVGLAVALAAFYANLGTADAISVSCVTRPTSPVGYEIVAIRADQAVTSRRPPPIAVLDTGIASVPELQGRVLQGYNVAGDNPNTFDIDGHGTAVASLAAAAAGGVRGVSPATPVLPIKIFDDAGNSDPETFIAAIERAVAADAGVINISAAGSPSDVDSSTKRAVQDAINAAVSLGIPVLAASGNEGSGRLDFPANLAHVIAVGATNETGDRADYSNSGTGLDLVAPGSNLITAAPPAICSSGYATATGTSFAVALASGAASMLLSQKPQLDVGQLTDMLRLAGPRSNPPTYSPELGFGMLNVRAALDAPTPTADASEVNDDIRWAKLQGLTMSATKNSKTVFARLAPHTDPADVYGVKLKQGQTFRARLTSPGGVKIALSFGSKKLAAKRGPQFKQKITKTGTYYVGAKLLKSPQVGAGYALRLSR